MSSKHVKRMIDLFKIAIEQGMLFNIPPERTLDPQQNDDKLERRVYEKPDSSGYYTCGNCKEYMLEDEIGYWANLGKTTKTFYNPKLDPNYNKKIINALNDAKNLIETFIDEYKKLPSLTAYKDDELTWQERNKLLSKYNILVDDYNDVMGEITSEHFINEETYEGLGDFKSLKLYFSGYNYDYILVQSNKNLDIINRELIYFNKHVAQEINYTYTVMQPICDTCYGELAVRCRWCSKSGLLNKNEDNFKSIGKKKYLCSKCYENSTECEKCHDVISYDDSFSDDENIYCEHCYDIIQKSKYYNIEPVQNIISKEYNNEIFFPVDIKQIDKTILPKILLPLKNRHFSIESIERQADKAKLAPDLKLFLMQTAKSENFSNMQELIDKLHRQVESDKQYKDKYPHIRRFNNLPIDIEIVSEDTGERDMPSFTIKIKPAEALVMYSETLFPGIGREALAKLTSGGHYKGVMAYARIGYDENVNAFIINNLQTDSDLQHLYTYDKELPESLNTMEPALRWWVKQFENWPVQMIDVAKNIGQKMHSKVYITSFDMQQNKWSRIPERNRDVYDKIPAQMGFKQERKMMTAESLGTNDYLMYRIAKLNRIRSIKKI